MYFNAKKRIFKIANIKREWGTWIEAAPDFQYLDGKLSPQLLAGAEGRATQICYMAQGSASTAAYPGAKSKHEHGPIECNGK